MDTVPEPERIAFVELVAITLDIPERGEPKGDQAFAQWQAQRAQPAADSAATASTETASTETPTPVPTPSDAAPEPVSPEAAKPAQANDPALQSPSELVRLEAQWRR
ncbi:mobilization protein, partial [Pseudomonas savastanoi pv. glycinea str. race 4]